MLVCYNVADSCKKVKEKQLLDFTIKNLKLSALYQ